MLSYKKILLASHGTKGAAAAERTAIQLAAPRTRIVHLIVVPEFWSGMQGDDWLNNASTRDTFGRYVENELQQEVARHVTRLKRQMAKRRLRYETHMEYGNPADCLLAYAAKIKPDLVVVGSLRPKKMTGYRSRMLTDDVLRGLKAPMLIAPYPHVRQR